MLTKIAALVAVVAVVGIAAKYSDNMMILLDGGIYAVGRPSEVVTESNLRAAYGVDARVIDDNGRPHMILLDDSGDDAEEYDDFGVEVPGVRSGRGPVHEP